MTDFLKMHGLGNDFIIFDWRDGGPATVSEAAARALLAAELNKEYISNSKPAQPLTANGNGISFVFLQKFPLSGMPFFFHTEVLVCPRSGFSQDDQDRMGRSAGPAVEL